MLKDFIDHVLFQNANSPASQRTMGDKCHISDSPVAPSPLTLRLCFKTVTQSPRIALCQHNLKRLEWLIRELSKGDNVQKGHREWPATDLPSVPSAWLLSTQAHPWDLAFEPGQHNPLLWSLSLPLWDANLLKATCQFCLPGLSIPRTRVHPFGT